MHTEEVNRYTSSRLNILTSLVEFCTDLSNVGELSIYKDFNHVDISPVYEIEGKYEFVPDIWIGEVELWRDQDMLLELGHHGSGYFFIHRNFGDPCIDDMIETGRFQIITYGEAQRLVLNYHISGYIVGYCNFFDINTKIMFDTN